MPFELHDFQDLVRFLRDHPDWREELRALLLTQELLTLPTLVRELAEVVKGLAERVDRLEGLQVTRGAKTAGTGLKVAVIEDGRVEGWEAALDRALQQGGKAGRG